MCGARPRSPLDADGRANAPSAGGADDVRPEVGRLARRRPPCARKTRDGTRRAARSSARRRCGDARRARRPGARDRAPLCARSSTSRSPRFRGTRTGSASRSSARPSAWPRAPLRRSAATSCSSRRARWPRSPSPRAEGPRRCRRSAIPSARRSRSRVPVSRTPTRVCCWATSDTSTSVASVAGTPNGRRCPARSPSPVAPSKPRRMP